MCGSRPRRCTSQSLTPLDVSAPHLILVSYAVPLHQESQAWTQRTPPKLLCPLLLSSLSTHNPATFLPLSRDLDFPCVKTDEEAMLNPGSDLHFNRSAWLVEHFKIAGCNFLKCFRVVQCTTARRNHEQGSDTGAFTPVHTAAASPAHVITSPSALHRPVPTRSSRRRAQVLRAAGSD
ncbi:hypothetical protein C8R44DRAFT_984189 [Mycena epipterygia]|nr:hypothetical protein C8R44DRAFT_984189 [Mycena epipterygia]